MDLRKYKIKKQYKHLYKFLNFEYEVYLSANGDEIEERFLELEEEGKEKGFSPLIIYPSDVLDDMLQIIMDDSGIIPTEEAIDKWRKETIESINELDPDEILDERMDDIYEYYDLVEGELIDMEPNHMVTAFEVEYEEIILAKVPTLNTWELPIWIPMGGFNDCPMPEEQAVVFKKWNENYGARPICLSYESWELKLDVPVEDEASCQLLAEEQMAFCEDIVFQSELESLNGLASSIKNSSIWLFWWD